MATINSSDNSPMATPAEPKPGIIPDTVMREEPEPDASRRKLVSDWQAKIHAAEKYWDSDFKRMRENMQLAYAGAPKQWVASDSYVIPIIMRYINQVVASLYAKNPTAVVEPKKKLDYQVWDGRPDTLQAAMQSIAQAIQLQQPPDPNLVAIVTEVSSVQQHKIMLKRVMKTLELVLQYYFGEQGQDFKGQLKQLVRRVKTCGIGYLYLGFQRKLEKMPEITAKIADVSDQIAKIESLAADLRDGFMAEDDARLDELKSMLQDLQAAEEVIIREGPIFDFPGATMIVVDTEVKQLNNFIGAGWIARKFFLDASVIQEVYQIDLTHGYSAYSISKDSSTDVSYKKEDGKSNNKNKNSKCCVYEVWNKANLQTFTLIDGYPDFVKEPATPEVPLKRFWPIFTLTFNDVEHESERYPLSDVHLLRHPQMEYNRSREMRRLHRKSNTPGYVVVKGKLDEADKKKLQSREDFAVLELNSLQEGESIDKVIQVLKGVPFDQAMYETDSEMSDVLRTVGAQEANLGGTSGATATEASIGENSRISSADSNADDLSEFLSAVTSSTGEMVLMELDIETVKKIAGPGAQWPHLSRAEIVEQVEMTVKAGSSGRPNKAAELANLERALPFLQQMSGVKSEPLAEKYCSLLDIDPDELIEDGLPSQVALNAMATAAAKAPPAVAGAAPGAPPSSVPAQQGPSGGGSSAGAPPPNMPAPGGQPGYTPPGPSV